MNWYTRWRQNQRQRRINHYTRRIAYITRELERVEVPFSLEEQFLTHERANYFFKRQTLLQKQRTT
jgi:hypothetical protein